jgi:K+-transporting ATPase KdpF subunit
LCVRDFVLGFYQSLRQTINQPRPEGAAFRKDFMDYIIAGIASFALFIYLLYALLRPEKF